MAKTYELLIKTKADGRDARREFDRTGKSAGKMGKALKSAAKTGAFLAGAAAVAGLAVAVRRGTAEYMESAKVGAETDRITKRLGASSRLSAGHVGKLADAISKKSGVDDEAIQAAANVLLQQGNINTKTAEGVKAFESATRAVSDYAVATGREPVGAAKAWAKAIADPTKNLKRLAKESGLTAQQQDRLVKQMKATKDPAKRQQILIEGLSKKYKGAGEAAGKTLPGQLRRAQNAFDNLAGKAVAKSIPHLEKFGRWIMKAGAAVKKFAASKEGQEVINALRTALESAFPQVREFIRFIKKLAGDFKKSSKSNKDFKKGLEVLKRAFVVLYRDVIPKVNKIIGTVLRVAFKVARVAIMAGVTALGKIAGALSTAKKRAADVADAIRKKWEAVKSFFSGLKINASGMFDGLRDAFRSAVNWIIGKWNDLSFGVTIKGKKFGAETPNIPYLASGGTAARAGLAMVGEQGPELLHLPRGASVIPLSTGGITIQNMTVVANDPQAFLKGLQTSVQRQAAYHPRRAVGSSR